jgi:hypothetical protein
MVGDQRCIDAHRHRVHGRAGAGGCLGVGHTAFARSSPRGGGVGGGDGMAWGSRLRPHRGTGGGGLAVTTHTTKLGIRYAIDMSPEPISNGATSTAELGLVTTIALTLWQHPYLTLACAIAVLVLLMYMVRLIWRTLSRIFAGRWVRRRGFLQDARTSDRLGRREDD